MKCLILAMTVLVSSLTFADSRTYTELDYRKEFVLATFNKNQKVEMKLNKLGTIVKLLVDGKKVYSFNIPGLRTWHRSEIEETILVHKRTLSSENLSSIGCEELKLTGVVEEITSPFRAPVYVINPNSISPSCL